MKLENTSWANSSTYVWALWFGNRSIFTSYFQGFFTRLCYISKHIYRKEITTFHIIQNVTKTPYLLLGCCCFYPLKSIITLNEYLMMNRSSCYSRYIYCKGKQNCGIILNNIVKDIFSPERPFKFGIWDFSCLALSACSIAYYFRGKYIF